MNFNLSLNSDINSPDHANDIDVDSIFQLIPISPLVIHSTEMQTSVENQSLYSFSVVPFSAITGPGHDLILSRGGTDVGFLEFYDKDTESRAKCIGRLWLRTGCMHENFNSWCQSKGIRRLLAMMVSMDWAFNTNTPL